MKTFSLSLAFGIALCASPAHADMIEAAIGNTVVVTDADGSVALFFFDADNTVVASWPQGEMQGTWALKDGEVCLDVGDGEPSCEDYPKGKKVGDTWTEVDDEDGSTLTISIEPGR